MSKQLPSEREHSATKASGDSSTPMSIGPYRIIKELGRGGQGVVYLAEHESRSTRVALKVLDVLSSQHEAARARFRREALAAAAVRHPGICGVVEAEVDSRTPYIAMEYVEGETLAQQLALTRTEAASDAWNVDLAESVSKPDRAAPASVLDRPAVMQAVAVFEQVARAVHAAHELGVIHRDLKPANIMIAKNGEPVILAESREYADELAALGANLLRQKNWEDAEAVLRPCCAIREKAAPAAWTTFSAKSMLGGALLGMHEFKEAEPLLLAACEGMKPLLGSKPQSGRPAILALAMRRLIELYTATGRQDEAARWTAARDAVVPRQPESRPSE